MTKKVLILQRVIPDYRVGIFETLSKNTTCNCKLLIGNDTADGKAVNTDFLDKIAVKKLESYTKIFFGRQFYFQKKLFQNLVAERPDVIVCEAESHFIGYLTAIFYKIFVNRNTKLLLWCFYTLPGSYYSKYSIRSMVKSFTRKFFEGFISYHSLGKKFLMDMGISDLKITVAHNVCDTIKHLEQSRNLVGKKCQIREKYGIEADMVVLFAGSLVPTKRPDFFLELAQRFKASNMQFLVAGDGVCMSQMVEFTSVNGLDNVKFFGHLGDEIHEVFTITDCLILPGRGGIIISEVMCYGIVPIVHQGDGIELDLIQDNRTGFIQHQLSLDSFVPIINKLLKDEYLLKNIQDNCKQVVTEHYTTEKMAEQVIKAVDKVLRKSC